MQGEPREERGLQSNQPDFGFPREYRITRMLEFKKYLEISVVSAGRYLVIRHHFDPEHKIRLGLLISKRGRNAIIVNRFKRLAREVFRLNRFRLKDHLQLIISFKKKIQTGLSYQEVEQDFLRILTREDLLKDDQSE